jgi:hypothetical protein
MIEMLITALIIVTLAHIILIEQQRKATIDYLYRVYNELVLIKSTIKSIEKKIEE